MLSGIGRFYTEREVDAGEQIQDSRDPCLRSRSKARLREIQWNARWQHDTRKNLEDRITLIHQYDSVCAPLKKYRSTPTRRLHLHALERLDTEQPQRRAEHVPRRQVQRHPRPRLVPVLLALDDHRLPRARDRVAQPERERHDPARLMRLQRRLHHVGVRPEQERDLARGRLDEQLRLQVRGRGERQELGVLALDGGQPDVCVLEVRAGVALEGEHAVPVEVVVVDTSPQRQHERPNGSEGKGTAWPPCPGS